MLMEITIPSPTKPGGNGNKRDSIPSGTLEPEAHHLIQSMLIHRTFF